MISILVPVCMFVGCMSALIYVSMHAWCVGICVHAHVCMYPWCMCIYVPTVSVEAEAKDGRTCSPTVSLLLPECSPVENRTALRNSSTGDP